MSTSDYSLQNLEQQELVHAALDKCMENLFYYDRKNDDKLNIGDIEEMVTSGVISIQDIVDYFENKLYEYI